MQKPKAADSTLKSILRMGLLASAMLAGCAPPADEKPSEAIAPPAPIDTLPHVNPPAVAVPTDTLPQEKLWIAAQGGMELRFELDTIYRRWSYGNGKYGHAVDYRIESIEVIRLSDHRLMQTIHPQVDDIEKRYWPVLDWEDINFDGHIDFRILSHLFMYSSTDAFWVFHPEVDTFSRVTALDEMENVEVLPHLEALHSGSHSGPIYFYHTLFQWRGGRLVKVGDEAWDDAGEVSRHSIAGLGPEGWMEGELYPDRDYEGMGVFYDSDSVAHLMDLYDYTSPGRLVQFLK